MAFRRAVRSEPEGIDQKEGRLTFPMYLDRRTAELIKQRRKRSRGRQDSQPRKRQRIDEAVVVEDRLGPTALIEMRSLDFRARLKMKPRRLILKEDSSTKSRRAALRKRHVQEAGPTERAAKEKEKSVGKKPRILEERSMPVEPPRASKKDKDTEEDLVALKGVAVKAVEDVAAAESGLQKVVLPRTSTDTIMLETGEEPSAEETQLPVMGAVDLLSAQVRPLLQYFDQKREKYAEGRTNESYVWTICPQPDTDQSSGGG
ncbi:hypothetical protein AXG93_4780s1000 [Marchantia polymorpha subsp. ruderalis]|uniref:Uncharacterized protein n=1 Tax=Marchantia polymorpha subsp. ruderalis TaxID=1480154 RepID=A0A176VM42_MARPO|nr:hypothetical protein AXG93_4780s1000 [Marchantia polymorpha subsp. ruderalis]